MITREDLLEHAAHNMILGFKPNNAIIFAMRYEDVSERIQAIDLAANEHLRPLPVNIAYLLDVSPNLEYTLTNHWRRLRHKGDYLISGSIMDDFRHRGSTPEACGRFLLASMEHLDLFPGRLATQVNEDLALAGPLPARAKNHAPFGSLPTATPAPQSAHRDLEGGPASPGQLVGAAT